MPSSNPGRCHGTHDDVPPVAGVELRQLPLAIGAGGQRDAPVGMQVIDVVERQERVQRRVDRRRDAVLAERAQRIEGDHLVFVRFAAVAARSAVRACRDTAGRSPEAPIDRRSPPLPFTASTRTGSPVSGSGSVNFELVLPPPKFVMRRSAPSRFDR